MAKFKCEPNYEYIKPGFHIQFDLDGNYSTNDKAEVKALTEASENSPFIKRLDKEEKPDKPAQKPAPKQAEKKSAKK